MGKLYQRRTHLCNEQLTKLMNKLEHMAGLKSHLDFDFTYWFNKAILNDLSLLANIHRVESFGDAKIRGMLSFNRGNPEEFFVLNYILEFPNGEKLFPYRFTCIHDLKHTYNFESNEGHDKFFPMQI